MAGSGITLREVPDTDIPTPPAGKDTLFFDSGTGEPSYKDDAGTVTSLVGLPGPGVPVGGTTGQVLAKINATDYNTQWVAPGLTNPMTTAGDIIYGGVSGLPTRLAIGATNYVLTVVAGAPAWAAAPGALAGTTNRITVGGGTIDIAATYVGQTSLTTLGTVTTGTWTGTTIALANGGTGQTSLASAIAAWQGNGLDVDAAGFRGIPQNSQSGNYTTVAADAGKHIYHPSGAGSGDTFTIDSNANVAYEIGTAITFINMDSNPVSIAIATDTMYLAGSGSVGTRTLAQYGVANAEKVGSTTWLISGVGLT